MSNSMCEITKAIEKMEKKLDAHIKEMEPIIAGWKTVKNVRSFIVWIAAPLLALGAIIAFIKGIK